MYTAYPDIDPRIPHFAAVFGAMPVPGPPDSGELSGDPSAGGDPDSDPRNPIPEILLGGLTSSVSGGVIGAAASGSWRGTFTGAAVNQGLWASYSLLKSWRMLGGAARAALGTSVLFSLTTASFLIYSRVREG